ncbi:DUF1168-domain-containing protein [Neolentinus lepideus HHB14362 ss-1]|uniref:DUF1168-domain-containing protein n=1 Tax=Neolentinus lepideus HHB14362 ss-1 TaxID=1314782 RepID=A0A165V043_9AGAM|nr:DUF1168-domain-containing protein [Neolentinus lepideus HHB14362 ss-1]
MAPVASVSPSPLPNAASHSPSPGPSGGPRHAQTPLDRQRSQLEKLLKDPAKPAYIPPPPKEKIVRAPREMMKNVQGSSAGAGSGEFHVYKASRRREYERLKLMEEQTKKEVETAEFEQKKREWEQQAEAKTAKNRAKRQKKKGKAKAAKQQDSQQQEDHGMGRPRDDGSIPSAPLKKRRLVSGKQLVFRRPGEESEEEDGGESGDEAGPQPAGEENEEGIVAPVPTTEGHKINIIEED